MPVIEPITNPPKISINVVLILGQASPLEKNVRRKSQTSDGVETKNGSSQPLRTLMLQLAKKATRINNCRSRSRPSLPA